MYLQMAILTVYPVQMISRKQTNKTMYSTECCVPDLLVSTFKDSYATSEMCLKMFNYLLKKVLNEIN